MAVTIYPLSKTPSIERRPKVSKVLARKDTELSVTEHDEQLFSKIKEALKGRPKLGGLSINRSVMHKNTSLMISNEGS